MAQSFRSKVQERDESAFVRISPNTTGLAVIDGKKRVRTPKRLEGGAPSVLKHFGKPDAEVPGVFEAIDYAKAAVLWGVSPITPTTYWGGVDIFEDGVLGFGARAERHPDSLDYADLLKQVLTTLGNGNGITTTFAGTIAGISAGSPIKAASFILKVAGIVKDATEASGLITGAAVSAGTLNLTSGAVSVTFNGTPGTKAEYVGSTVDLSSPIDLSSGGTDKKVNITIDGVVFENVNFGQSNTTSSAAIIAAINGALGYTAASLSGNYIRVIGQIGDATYGHVVINNPTSGDSALTLIFDSGATGAISETVLSTSPTGFIPKYNQSVTTDVQQEVDYSALVSHSLFRVQACDDTFEPLGIRIAAIGGSRFTYTLYEKIDGKYFDIETQTYSLLKEKDSFGKSLYILDIFNNHDYIEPKINSAFVGTYSWTATTVDLTGGARGATAQASHKLTAWAHFQQKNKYPGKIVMDFMGDSHAALVDLRDNYQPYAFYGSCVPLGNNSAAAIAFRQGLSIDNDGIACITNWTKVIDPYNNSFAWVSRVGAWGVKMAAMADVYDGLSPAGTDENGHGGQLSGFTPVETEYDYSETEKEALDLAQLNPVVLDPVFGLMVEGDKTLQVALSDTSFIMHRRLFNLIIDTTLTQVLRQQQFKLNDVPHRFVAQTLTENILAPIIAQGLLRGARVVCDTTNNTDLILSQRKFVIDIIVQVTPNSQETLLRLTRVSQTVQVASVVPLAA